MTTQIKDFQISGGIIPTGAVIVITTSVVPNIFFECDGSAVSRTVYANLFAEIGTLYGVGDGSTTFNLPDYRSEFLRGWDNGKGIDIGRAIASGQLDALQNITGFVGVDYGAVQSASGAFSGPISSAGTNANGGTITVGRNFDFDASRVARTSTETRPRNKAVMFCIKY